ncbi:hypothetical protein [Alloactinosynnema sp. L-07]|uniref:hypothetical protein n=1 Tax=Alloactinosynnema sp. L-07 TaxID=1653480 RepID=UPI00065F041F|nr:hypothetical protein [Alloactinosynnema sp. L-07]CRK56977.1 hypothetical protein [Alloactinosynnema sp. L-07]
MITATYTDLFADVLAETSALELLHHELGAQFIADRGWRDFDDHDAYADLVRIDLETAELGGSDW